MDAVVVWGGIIGLALASYLAGGEVGLFRALYLADPPLRNASAHTGSTITVIEIVGQCRLVRLFVPLVEAGFRLG